MYLSSSSGDTWEGQTVDINTKDMYLSSSSGDTWESPTVDINTKDMYLSSSSGDTWEGPTVDIYILKTCIYLVLVVIHGRVQQSI